jgi:hypothetical protein
VCQGIVNEALRRRESPGPAGLVRDRDLIGLLTSVVDPGMFRVPTMVKILNPLVDASDALIRAILL